ncbi:MAG: UbiX family flavin prenyltransferase [Chloroflexi bacterium]|nr:UbiX family flavin prenyltransferase [Chloroflexota bacterium]
MKLVVGISGASGAIYGVRLLEVLATMPHVETHLIISRWGEEIISHEMNLPLAAVKKLATYCYDVDELGARVSSGSFTRDGMVIAPCSVKTMSALAHSYTENLLVRAGDVTLKERKRLVLVPRETPLHLGHLRTMVQLTEMGAIILPPVPSFYNRPKTVDDIVNHTVGRILDLFDLKHDLFPQWSGIDATHAEG